jgi:hypothetical protein
MVMRRHSRQARKRTSYTRHKRLSWSRWRQGLL